MGFEFDLAFYRQFPFSDLDNCQEQHKFVGSLIPPATASFDVGNLGLYIYFTEWKTILQSTLPIGSVLIKIYSQSEYYTIIF
jgi:hypothetical protein